MTQSQKVWQDYTADQLVTVQEVSAYLRMGRTTLWELERRGEFPPSIMLSRRSKRWRVADIEAYVESRRPPAAESRRLLP